MNNTGQRLILFFVAVPLLIGIVVFTPWYGHVSVIAILTVAGLLCGLEMRAMLAKAAKPLHRITVLAPAVVPLLSWSINMGWLPEYTGIFALAAAVLIGFGGAVLAPEEELSKGFNRIGSRLLFILYPCFLIWWVARLTWFDQSHWVILVFMTSVFINDSWAWLFGVVMGKHRGVFAVSPKKSLEGFLGGLFGSVLVFIICPFVFPDIFTRPWWVSGLFGLVLGISVIAGDLSESALKRALGVKDSGHVILGRGGMLDSMDSVLFAAPVFTAYMTLGMP